MSENITCTTWTDPSPGLGRLRQRPSRPTLLGSLLRWFPGTEKSLDCLRGYSIIFLHKSFRHKVIHYENTLDFRKISSNFHFWSTLHLISYIWKPNSPSASFGLVLNLVLGESQLPQMNRTFKKVEILKGINSFLFVNRLAICKLSHL